MDDIAMKFDKGRFRFRSVGVIIQNNKILMVYDDENKFYYGIGGAVHIGECSSDAAVREVFEESGLIVEVERLLFTEENFFEMKDGMHHEIAFYYLMKDIGSQRIENEKVLDSDRERLVWLDIHSLEGMDVHPRIYCEILDHLPDGIIHSVCDRRTQ